MRTESPMTINEKRKKRNKPMNRKSGSQKERKKTDRQRERETDNFEL